MYLKVPPEIKRNEKTKKTSVDLVGFMVCLIIRVNLTNVKGAHK